MLSRIALESLKDRKGAAILCLISIVVSVALLLMVDNIRSQAKQSFGRTVSGVDLIVGAPTGQVNLLLYSVFRMGSPSNSVDWKSIEALQQSPGVKWVIPIALGDSHHGFQVMGTTTDYFTEFHYGRKQSLQFRQGQVFNSIFDTVIGADVAAKHQYSIGDEIVLSHGVGHTSFSHHQHSPFRISGILAATGTPVDQTIHVKLAGLKAAHLSESEIKALMARLDNGQPHNLQPEKVTAAFIGMHNRIQALQLQHRIKQYDGEPLMAILPGVALAELWQLVGNVESLLLLISSLILLSSLMGMATMLLTSIRERQREFAVLRAIGASPINILILIQVEALLISVTACIVAIAGVWLTLIVGQDWLSQEYGLFIDSHPFTSRTLGIVGVICVVTAIIAFIPAINAYRRSLQQGLTVK